MPHDQQQAQSTESAEDGGRAPEMCREQRAQLGPKQGRRRGRCRARGEQWPAITTSQPQRMHRTARDRGTGGFCKRAILATVRSLQPNAIAIPAH